MRAPVSLSHPDLAPLPARAGIGLRSEHYQAALADRPAAAFLEVHAENYFGDGGRPLAVLSELSWEYPLSLHGVGLSLGSTDPLNEWHLARIERLVDRFEPALVSEHLSWSSVGGRYFNDLLPLPYTEEALAHVVARIGIVQDRLRRPILVENPSSYLEYEHSTIPEWEFLAAVATRSGCGLLLDVNNVYVSAVNHGFDARQYLRAVPASAIAEIHLAGHTVRRYGDAGILIDTHDQRVCPAVWQLYADAIALYGPRPTLIEWDSNLPPLAVLEDEARQAQRYLEADHALAA
jgi:hypothetical protein